MKSCGTQDLLKPIRWLFGRWRSVSASLQFPDFENVDFVSNLNILENGMSPTFFYTSIGTHGINRNNLYYANGFMHMIAKNHSMYLYCVEKRGLMSVELGKLEGTALHFVSRNVYELPFVEQSLDIKKIERSFKMRGKKLQYRLMLQMGERPLEEMASIVYEKDACDDIK